MQTFHEYRSMEPGPVVPGNSYRANASVARTLLVDDHPFVLDGLAGLLNAQADFQVIERATTVAAGIAHLRESRPSLVLVDLRLPDGDGSMVLQAAGEMKWETYSVVLSAFCSDDDLSAAARGGARAFLLKTDRSEKVLSTLRRVMQGENVLMKDLPPHLRERLAHKDLTAKELEILRLIGGGLTNRHISDRTGLAGNTVKVHLRRIFRKLGVTNRAEAAAIAVRRGLVPTALAILAVAGCG